MAATIHCEGRAQHYHYYIDGFISCDNPGHLFALLPTTLPWVDAVMPRFTGKMYYIYQGMFQPFFNSAAARPAQWGSSMTFTKKFIVTIILNKH